MSSNIGLQIGVFVVICSFLLSPKPIFSENNEISFWQFWKSEWIEPAIVKFEAENKPWKVKIERLTWSGGKNKLITALAAGYGPDVMEIGSTWAAEFITSGVLAEFKTSPASLAALDTARYQGKLYALPWVISVASLYYNKPLLKAAGINDPPKNWDELLTAAQKINQPQEKVYGFGVKTGAEVTWQRFIPFVWSNGADVLGENNQVLPNKKAFIEALAFYKELNSAGLLDSNLLVRQAFLEERLGFIIDDPGQYGYFKKNAESLDFAVIPLPLSPINKRVTFGGAELLAVNSRSAHVAKSQEFVEFMVNYQNAMLISKNVTSIFPADKKSRLDDFYTVDHPELAVFLSEIDYARSTPVNSKWFEVQKSLVLNVEKVLYGRLSPEEAAAKLEGQIKLILEE